MGKHVAPKHSSSEGRGSRRNVSRAAAADSAWSDWESERRRSDAKSRSRTVIVIAVVLVVVILAAILLAYLVFNRLYSRMNYTPAPEPTDRSEIITNVILPPEEEPAEDELAEDVQIVSEQEKVEIQDIIQQQLEASGGSLISDKDVINILLIGSDARSRTELARSDVMILLSANKNTHKIVITSFMRDIYTYIPDFGYNRLNAPYALAGADYLIETLEADFGVDIDNYAAVNFYDFANIIDAVGGVDLALSDAEVSKINEYVNWEQNNLGVGSGSSWLDYSSDGMYHLNGTQALAFCRNRSSAGSDFDRTERQRKVISALIEKAKGMSMTQLYNLANIVLPMVSTDLTRGDCLSLLLNSADYLGYERETLRIPAVDYYNTYIDGMAVLSIDFSSNAALVQDTIYN